MNGHRSREEKGGNKADEYAVLPVCMPFRHAVTVNAYSLSQKSIDKFPLPRSLLFAAKEGAQN